MNIKSLGRERFDGKRCFDGFLRYISWFFTYMWPFQCFRWKSIPHIFFPGALGCGFLFYLFLGLPLFERWINIMYPSIYTSYTSTSYIYICVYHLYISYIYIDIYIYISHIYIYHIYIYRPYTQYICINIYRLGWTDMHTDSSITLPPIYPVKLDTWTETSL